MLYENGGCKWADAAMSILCPQPEAIYEENEEVGGNDSVGMLC